MYSLFFGNFLFLSFDFPMLCLIDRLIVIILGFVFLVYFFKPCFVGFVDSAPHRANDLGDLGYFGGRVLGFHIVIDLPTV